jgi:hypothetical protein
MIQHRNVPQRGNDGRFLGFRVNCEQVPRLPAWAVRAVWGDPRGIPYLMLWQDPSNGEIKEVLRVKCHPEPAPGRFDKVEIKRLRVYGPEWIHVLWRSLPRGGGRVLLLVCPSCGKPCRALYAWGVGVSGGYYCALQMPWGCRKCNGLRYSSEGGALLLRYAPVCRALGIAGPVSCGRPESWHPLIFSHPAEAVSAGFDCPTRLAPESSAR